MLRGEALEEGGELRVFSAAALPREPAARFAALFARLSVWPETAIAPYVAGIEVGGLRQNLRAQDLGSVNEGFYLA